MKGFKTTLLILGTTLMVLSAGQVRAQFMPVVYDNTYGRGSSFITACADFDNGDVVTASMNAGRITLTWIDRQGEARFTKQFGAEDINKVTSITALSQDKVLVVGSRAVAANARATAARQTGRSFILTRGGGIERSLNIGQEGTVIKAGAVLANGNIILAGTTPNAKGGMSGFVSKIGPNNRVVYNYVAATGETCDWFNVLGSRTEYLNAAFTSENGSGSSVVRLDENGDPYFITTISDPSFRVEKMVSTLDGDVYLVGEGAQTGGAIVKIRPEGDIVYQKQIVPATPGTALDHLMVLPTGELLMGGHDNRNAYFALLRSDGTELRMHVDMGKVVGIAVDPVKDDCIVSMYSDATREGKVVKISKQGRLLYDKLTAASYSSLRIDVSGDLLMAAPASGRLTMLSNLGLLLFDRYVVENDPQQFAEAILPMNGEAFFADVNNRMAKLAHGIYVSDIVVNKPIEGYTTAVFTVTLSGYSFASEGTPRPVTVNYKTAPISAKEGLNFEPVNGTLSFVPSADGNDRYLNKYVVEVPVLANDLLEGNRLFSLDLSSVTNSYLIKSTSRATIADQPAVVRMVSTTPGLENEKDVTFTLGLFKTNGTPITNKTGADIVIDGTYGKGTSDNMDYDSGRIPRLVIAADQHQGVFNVVTVEDARYESVKTVVVNFDKVYAMSDTEVSFGSNILICTGDIYDQPAMLTIESLGDYTRINNVVSGLFRVNLVRARDGMPQVNASGSDIMVKTVVNSSSTAVQGVNFVLANAHDLRIWGDDKSSAVNLNGMVLYSPDSGTKTVSVSLDGVEVADKAGPISVDAGKKTAQFNIVYN